MLTVHVKRDWLTAALIFAGLFAVYRLSPIHPIYDSRYEMFFSQQLLWEHSAGAKPTAFPELKSHKPGQVHTRGIDFSYHLIQKGDRFYYLFPPGTVILSIPFVALANMAGISTVDSTGTYDEFGELRIQSDLAALLTAAFGTVIFLTSRIILSLSWSVLLSVGTALGSQMWSTASRSMWIHTWGILIMGVAVWLILRTEVTKKRLPPFLLATALSWSFFVRPTFAIPIAVIAVWILIYHRNIFLPFAVTGVTWLGLFIAYCYYAFGEPLPMYIGSDWSIMNFGRLFGLRLAGSLVSPARGLLVYSPILLFLAYLLVRYRRELRPNLPVLALIIICLHLLFISNYILWHGGHCYGPRYTTDLIPWFVLLSILGVEARLRWRTKNRDRDTGFRIWTETSIATLLLACSITLHGIGAISVEAWRWNAILPGVEKDPARLWDWKHAPFLGPPAPAPTDQNIRG